MSRFYGSMECSSRKSKSTKCGHADLTSHTRGWDIGIRVEMCRGQGDTDVAKIYVTGGSNGASPDSLLAVVTDGLVTISPNHLPPRMAAPRKTRTFDRHKRSAS